MVDFRYHLVSLMSVFLALAVGIILGAGPLQNSIGNTLNSQVDTLREARDTYRDRADSLQESLDSSDSIIEAAGKQIIPGTLTDKKIALIGLPQVSDDEFNRTADTIAQAGGSVNVQLRLTKNFADSQKASYRKALAEQMKSYLGDVPSEAKTDTLIASIVNYLVRHEVDDSNSAILMSTVSGQENKLFDVVAEQSGQSDVIVFLAPALDAKNSSEDKAERDVQVNIYTQAFRVFADNGPAVLVGTGGDGTVLASARDAKIASTVDSLGTIAARINTALASAQEIAGTHVSVGVDRGADSPLAQAPEKSE